MTISNLEIQNTNSSVFIYLFIYFTIFVTMQINDKKTASLRYSGRTKKGFSRQKRENLDGRDKSWVETHISALAVIEQANNENSFLTHRKMQLSTKAVLADKKNSVTDKIKVIAK